MKGLFDLNGRVALVTGATHGLGMAMATALGRAGARVVINDISAEKLEIALGQYSAMGLDVRGYLFDVTDEVAVGQAIQTIAREVGAIDILVNNAGIIKRVRALDMAISDWRMVLDVDLTAPFIVSCAVARGMVESGGGGKIINICSMMSEVGRDNVSAYAAAKGGLKMLTRNLATEWARYNIQVNGIGPGYFATEQTAPLRTEGHPFDEFIVRRTPAGRWGVPEDLAGTVVYLSSAASNFVNGQVVYVDGGILASLGKASHEE